MKMAIAARMAAMKAIMMYSTISFAYKLDVIGTGMDELELESAGEAFVKGVGSLETAGVGFLGVELGGRAEFLYPDGGDGQFLSGYLGEEVETVAARHAKPVGEVGGWDMLAVEHA